MTISSTTRTAGPFTGDGVSTAFPFAFKLFSAADLFVGSVEIAGGALSTLALASDYTAALNANQDSNPGGTVTLTAPLAIGYRLVISTNIGNLQSTAYLNHGGFYPEVLTASLDTLTILVQQLQAQVDRAIKIPATDPALTTQVPSAESRAGLFLAFDPATGAAIASPITSTVPNYGIATVAYTATPLLNANLGSKLVLRLTGNAAPTFTSGGSSGVFFSVQITQDGTGGHTLTWPANMKNMGVINPAANSVSEQFCSLDATGTARGLGPIMYS
jgi:hypothetical protein